MAKWQLQGLDPRAFVSEYWQKKPCIIRNAFADFESPVSPEELAGLACEEDVHCRLVVEQDGDAPWQLRYGPFAEKDFASLPETHYTLLVSECEKWLPDLAGILDQFRFIPDWRIDDLMVSYAPAGGSVGPHVDEYDVFLLQAMGTRRWQYCESRLEEPQLIPGLELAILRDFEPEHEVVLNPGDVLYLPPGVAHHGVALEPAMTYSIGFRAPTATAALESFALEIESLGGNIRRYSDPDLELDRHCAEITDNEIARFRALAAELLEQSDELWLDAVGKMLTESPLAHAETRDQPVYISDLLVGDWMRHPDTRMLYHRSANRLRFYYNGQVHEMPAEDTIVEWLQQLCERREWSREMLGECIRIESLEALVLEMANQGAIIMIED